MKQRRLLMLLSGLLLAACSQAPRPSPSISDIPALPVTPTSGISTPTTGVSTPTTGVSVPSTGTSTPTAGVSTPTTGVSTPSSGTSTPSTGISLPSNPPVTPTPPADPTPVNYPVMDGTEFIASDADAAEGNARLAQLSATPVSSQNANGIASSAVVSDMVMANGSALFPVGFYHVSWASDSARRLRDMNAIADLGFNTMAATMLGSAQDDPSIYTLLHQAQARGMHIMLEDAEDDDVRALKSEPAVLSWLIGDDCNTTLTPAQLLARNQQRHSIDTNHLTYASLDVSLENTHAEYFDKADAIGDQIYPIDNDDAPIDSVYKGTRLTVQEAQKAGSVPIANLQSFAWPHGHYPTTSELYNMTNQALAAGARGILYYTYLDKTTDLTQQPALLAQLRRVASQVKLLSPVLLSQNMQVLSTSSKDVHASLWSVQGRRYLEVVSVNHDQSVQVSLTVPNAARLSPLFAGQATGFKLAQNVASGQLSPLSVHWYEVR